MGEPKRGSLVTVSEVLLCSHFDQKVCQHTVVVDTEADQANIKVLYSDLESALTRIDVSIF
jgi:hypothetical protein